MTSPISPWLASVDRPDEPVRQLDDGTQAGEERAQQHPSWQPKPPQVGCPCYGTKLRGPTGPMTPPTDTAHALGVPPLVRTWLRRTNVHQDVVPPTSMTRRETLRWHGSLSSRLKRGQPISDTDQPGHGSCRHNRSRVLARLERHAQHRPVCPPDGARCPCPQDQHRVGRSAIRLLVLLVAPSSTSRR